MRFVFGASARPAKQAARQPKTMKRVPKCRACNAEMFCLGCKVEVPKKGDTRGWRRLRDDCRERAIAAADAGTGWQRERWFGQRMRSRAGGTGLKFPHEPILPSP